MGSVTDMNTIRLFLMHQQNSAVVDNLCLLSQMVDEVGVGPLHRVTSYIWVVLR